MGRIRTIKPEFFTSEDIVALPYHARLLYIATWCEADREGRLVYKPLTLKMRYFPADNFDVQEACNLLVTQGLLTLYGDGNAFIPSFSSHQHINPRETPSKLPDPHATVTRHSRVGTRANLDMHAQVGKERKGKISDASEPVGFASFFETWPSSERKGGRSKCLEIWKKAGLEKDSAVILSHVAMMKSSQSWMKNNGEFIPAPSSYLNQRKWDGANEIFLVSQQETKFV